MLFLAINSHNVNRNSINYFLDSSERWNVVLYLFELIKNGRGIRPGDAVATGSALSRQNGRC